MNRRDAAKEQFWRRLVRQQRESGSTIRAFCREQGVRETTFHFWKRELVRRRGERSKKQSALQGSLAPAAFAEVRVEPEASPEISPIEIVLATERRVRIAPGFDSETLKRVLAVLEELAC